MKALDRLDARGWIALAVYALVLIDVLLLATVPGLRGDEFFKTISTLIFGAFLKDVVGWAFQATQGGSDLANRNASIVEDAARAPSVPQSVVIDQPADKPVPVETTV